MRKFKKLTAAVLSAAIALTVGATSSFAVEKPVSKSESKITEELWAVLNESADDDMIPVYIWTNDIDYNAVESKTIQTVGFSKNDLMEKSNKLYEPLRETLASEAVKKAEAQNRVALSSSADLVSAEEVTKAVMQDFYTEHKADLKALSDTVDEYISTRKSVAWEAYNEQNSDFADNYLKNGKMIFQSGLAPMFICELPKRDILKLNSVNEIDTLSLYEDVEIVDCGDIETHVNIIKGNSVRDVLFCDGSGVKVGQIEKGLPYEKTPELSNVNFSDPYGPPEEAEFRYHASVVAAIMVGNTGMAPKVEKLYCGTTKKEETFYSPVENIAREVNVINASMGFYAKDPSKTTYGDLSRWVDHIVYQHYVSWVNAAGNSGSYIASPANAYNVITVGGIDDKGTTSTNDDYLWEKSNYITLGVLPSKPDVVAPACGFYLSNGIGGDGTSFAAPLVTGMIAQMMSFNPTLKFRPDAVKAAVIASCDRKTTGEALGQITNKEGAGVVNALIALNAFIDVMAENTYYDTSAKTTTYKFTPKSSGMKTVAITWFKRSEASDIGGHYGDKNYMSSYGFENFDLYVLDNSGKVVASSTSTNNSVEIVRFSANENTTYTVEIRRISGGSSKETIALAHTR